MGGQSGGQKQETQTSNPWEPAQGTLRGILGQIDPRSAQLTGAESGAIGGLSGLAAGGNKYAGRIGGVADELLGGGVDRTGIVNDAYAKYQQQLNPFARGDYVNPESNPALRGYLDTIKDDISKSLGSQYAASGRSASGSGAFGNNFARGYTEGAAPTMLNAYNQGIQGQRSAIDSLYSGGQQTAGLLSNLDQTRLGNKVAGIGAAGAAREAEQAPFMEMLKAESLRRGIPLQALAQMAGIAVPIAGLGGQKTGTTDMTQQMSGADWFAKLAGGMGSLFSGGGQAYKAYMG